MSPNLRHKILIELLDTMGDEELVSIQKTIGEKTKEKVEKSESDYLEMYNYLKENGI